MFSWMSIPLLLLCLRRAIHLCHLMFPAHWPKDIRILKLLYTDAYLIILDLFLLLLAYRRLPHQQLLLRRHPSPTFNYKSLPQFLLNLHSNFSSSSSSNNNNNPLHLPNLFSRRKRGIRHVARSHYLVHAGNLRSAHVPPPHNHSPCPPLRVLSRQFLRIIPSRRHPGLSRRHPDLARHRPGLARRHARLRHVEVPGHHRADLLE